MFPKIGPLEIIVILIVILILFGPKHLPKLANTVGQSIKNLREGMGKKKNTTTAEVDDSVEEVVVQKPAAGLKAAESKANAAEVEVQAEEVVSSDVPQASAEGETE